jgi:uncharacterized membrane protein YkvI
MNRRLLQVHAAVAWLFVASIVVQVFLAGAAITQLGGSGTFASHIDFGYSIGIVALVLVMTAAVARAGRNAIAASLGLLVLYVIQTLLPGLRDSFPWASALHPVNALLLFALAAWYARRAWRSASVVPAN